MSSNAVPPSVVPPSPYEWLQTVFPITNVSRDAQAIVTCSSYPFTSQDVNVTSITFKQIRGMIQMNGITALIVAVIDSSNFVVNVNSTNFATYQSGGVICIDTGQPPIETQGFQTFNTPFQNIA